MCGVNQEGVNQEGVNQEGANVIFFIKVSSLKVLRPYTYIHHGLIQEIVQGCLIFSLPGGLRTCGGRNTPTKTTDLTDPRGRRAEVP